MIMETKETQCHPKPLVNATCLLGKKGCYENGKCHYIGSCEHKVLTNADRIRAMTDEELAEWLARTQIEAIKDAMTILRLPYDESDEIVEMGKAETLEWLQQLAKGDA
jgi:hypothetical protein